jgi:RNA polymerase sigma-70 factor (ECF subfamily)
MTAIDPTLLRRLHARARGDRWRLSMSSFAEALSASTDRSFGGRAPSMEEVERYVTALHLEDLALARACIDGDEEAWEHVVREYRPALYRAADALDGSGAAREIADALYGDLFGGSANAADRRPLLLYFHGRSSLLTWLRSVLAQRVVDRVRVRTRERPLPDDESPGALPSPQPPADPERERQVRLVSEALAGALAALQPRDRLRLGWYYAEEMTLAEIGRVLHEHEATVSRQLARVRQAVRADVERRLRDQGVSDDAMRECFASLAADAGPLNLRHLIGVAGTGPAADAERKEDTRTRSKREQRV